MRPLPALLAALVTTTCLAGRPPDAGVLPAAAAKGSCHCQHWGVPHLAGLVENPALVELSGLAASHRYPGVLYAHNDSGDTARFFAMSQSGKNLAEFDVDGGIARDWEDIAVGPCGEQSCVFLGDIGDNWRRRTDYAIYRLPEPKLSLDGGAGVFTVEAAYFPYQYPGGEKHNAEALLVHPITGRVYLISKEKQGTPSFVYRFPEPLVPDALNVLVPVATLSFPLEDDTQITAADFGPCGNAVLVRMYNRLVLLEGEGDAVWHATPREVPVGWEPQGEAVTFSLDGKSYFTSTEKKGETVPLLVVRCADAP